MPIEYTTYGSLVDALTYFDNRLHADPWHNATVDDKRRALIAATRK